MSEAQLAGQVVGGKYRVLNKRGQDATGVLYEAQDETGKRFALKRLHGSLLANAEARARLLHEAQLAATIRHPNLIDLYEVVEHAGGLVLVMEHVEGETLADYLERGERPIPEIVRLLIDALRGMAAVHKLGLVHRDLKPEDIFLARRSKDGDAFTPKLRDFGLAKLFAPETDLLKRTQTGSTFRTPRYTSYEQLMDLGEVDARSDVYSFGVIAYEALTGRVPYSALNFQQLLDQFGTKPPKRLRRLRPTIPQELEEVVLRTLSQDRSRRPQSVDALIAELKPFAGNDPLRFDAAPVLANPTPPPAPVPRVVPAQRSYGPRYSERDLLSVKHRRRLRSRVVYAVCAAVAIVVWLLKPSDDERARRSVPAEAVEPAAPRMVEERLDGSSALTNTVGGAQHGVGQGKARPAPVTPVVPVRR